VKTKILLIPILFLLFSVLVSGEGFATGLGPDRVVDNAGLLNASQRNDLINLTDAIASAYHFDLVIVTETDIGNISPGDYANDFFDDNGYGIGDSRDGCLFLRVTGSRDFWFSTSGRGIKVLNSFAGQKLESDTGKYLGEGNPYAAFRAFILDWDQFLSLEAKGRSYNFFYQWNLVIMIIVWLLALGIGFAVVSFWKRDMNTALLQTQAAGYVVPGSLNFTVKKESFLYSSTNKVKKNTSSGSSLVKGALSAGSSGMRHGGRGGRR
jgi:uncharacterized protein